MKTAAYILIGAVLMFVVLKFISTKPIITSSETSDNFKLLLKTDAGVKLLASDEFSNLLLTKEFKNLLRGISDEYLQTITANLLK